MDIDAVRRLREQYESTLDEADAARDAYHAALKELHRSGVPLREIANQLGMSHQRVHQIVGVLPPKEKGVRLRRAAGVGGAITALALAVAGLAIVLSESDEGGPPTRIASALSVDVTTKGQSWRFDFRDYGVSVSGRRPELVFPSDTRISLTLRTPDADHAFWIPRLAPKQHFAAGRVTTVALDTGRPGVYVGRDAEFADLPYRLQEFKIVVVTRGTFDRWISGGPSPSPPDTDFSLASAAYSSKRPCPPGKAYAVSEWDEVDERLSRPATTRTPSDRRTWWSGTSPLPDRTACGSPTSPTSGPGPGSATSRSCKTCSPG